MSEIFTHEDVCAQVKHLHQMPRILHNESHSWGGLPQDRSPERVRFCSHICMSKEDVSGPPDDSHDDVSNPGSKRPDTPVVDNEAHDRDDDGPSGPDPKIPGKPMSDMAPAGQDDSEGPE